MRYGFEEISSSLFNWTIALTVRLFVVTLQIYYHNDPNKATKLTWGQWDYIPCGKWGQYIYDINKSADCTQVKIVNG